MDSFPDEDRIVRHCGFVLTTFCRCDCGLEERGTAAASLPTPFKILLAWRQFDMIGMPLYCNVDRIETEVRY